MRILQWLLMVGVFAAAGCGVRGVSPEGVYEGLKTRERVLDQPAQSAPAQELPGYGEYEAERKRVLE